MPSFPVLGRLRTDAAPRAHLHGLAGPALALAGMALLTTGAVAVFASTNTTGTAALIAAGLALVAIAVYGDRVETVEAAGIKVSLQQQAASKLVEAEVAEAAGDLDGAERLRGEAARLLEAARSVAMRYETIRATQSSSWQRTEALDQLIKQESRALSGIFTSPAAVRALFRAGDEGNRIVAIAMMAANPSLADPETIAEAITASRSAFEQYYALKAAEAVATRTPGDPRMAEVRTAVRTALASEQLQAADSDRGNVARHVLGLLDDGR